MFYPAPRKATCSPFARQWSDSAWQHQPEARVKESSESLRIKYFLSLALQTCIRRQESLKKRPRARLPLGNRALE